MSAERTFYKLVFENGYVPCWYIQEGDLFYGKAEAHKFAAEIKPGMSYELATVQIPIFTCAQPHVIVNEEYGYASWLWLPETETLAEAKDVFWHYVKGLKLRVCSLGSGKELPGIVMRLASTIGGLWVDVYGRRYFWPVNPEEKDPSRGVAHLHAEEDSSMWIPEEVSDA